MPLKTSDVETLVELFGQSTWEELRLEVDGDELLLSTNSHATLDTPATPGTVPSPSAPPTPPPARDAGPAPAARPAHWLCVKAPNLGTFYTCPAPSKPPYVSVGATVTADTEVCLIEVMKLFTTVRASVAGTVREITAKDGEMVEYDQPLLWIEPT